MEDRIFEHGVEPLANAHQRLRDPHRVVGQRAHAAQSGKQRGRRDGIDGGVPDVLGDVVLERGDPLRRVLDRARGLDDALVILAGGPGQGRALTLRRGLLLRLERLGGDASTFALVDRVDAALQKVAGVARQVACRREAFAGLRVAAQACHAESHLAPAPGRGGVAEHPTGGLAANPEDQAATIRSVALGGCENLPHRELVQVRNDALASHGGPLSPVCPPLCPPVAGDSPLRAIALLLRVS